MNKIKALFAGLNYKRAGKSLLLAILVAAIFVGIGFLLAVAMKVFTLILGTYAPFLLIGGFIIWAAVETYNDRFIFVNDRAILAEDDKSDSVLI